MKSAPLLLLAGVFLLFPLLTVSCAGSAKNDAPGSAGSAGAPMTDTCTVDADCTWGEIPKELLKASDCPCLYGCGYLPQTTATQERRGAQYEKLCNPAEDGKGNQCGIDDCAPPGDVRCIGGTCSALNTMR